MTDCQNQTKENKQKQEEITYDDLCYMRQNALVNYSRSSKQKQEEINVKIKDTNPLDLSCDNFISSVETIFNDTKSTYDKKNTNIVTLSRTL